MQIGKEASPDWQPQFLGPGERLGPAVAVAPRRPEGRSNLGIVIGVIAALGRGGWRRRVLVLHDGSRVSGTGCGGRILNHRDAAARSDDYRHRPCDGPVCRGSHIGFWRGDGGRRPTA